MRSIGLAAALGFVATVWLANLLVDRLGVVPVGFGLHAPAAVFAAGLAFTLRDATHRTLGRRAVLLAIAAGGILSILVNPQIALASTVAFTASELVDLGVFATLEARSLTGAVVASNVIGAIVDSYLFLTISGIGLAFFAGQVVGKTWVTAATVAAIAATRAARAVLPRHA